MNKKICCLLFLIFSICAFSAVSLFAIEFELGATYDNYGGGNGVGGFNLDIREELGDKFKIFATVENKYNVNYQAWCGGTFDIDKFGFAVAVFFDGRNALLTPGMFFDLSFKIPKILTLGASCDFTFTPANVFLIALVDAKGRIIIHRPNYDATLKYEFERFAVNSVYTITHKGKIDVLAFTEGFPFKMGITIGVEANDFSSNKYAFDVGVNAAARLIFDFGKGGTYTLKGECEFYRNSRAETTPPPFAVCLSAKYKIK